MDDHNEVALRDALNSMAPSYVQTGCRAIRAGDADLLRGEEQVAITARNPEVRRASGAARHLVRELLLDHGHPDAIIGRQHGGAPVWPVGIKGSLAHDQHMAVAAISSAPHIASVGIDVEAPERLPEDLGSVVISATDNLGAVSKRLAGRAAFAAKEAVYKAAYPLDGVILDYADVVVDFDAACGATRTGHVAQLYWCLMPRLVVLAVIPAER